MLQIPAKPFVESGKPYKVYDLHEGTCWEKLGTFSVVDIAPGFDYRVPNSFSQGSDYMFQILVGSALKIVSDGNVVPHYGGRTYGQLTDQGKVDIVNPERDYRNGLTKPARIVLMLSYHSWGNAVQTKLGLINSLPYDPRPQGIKLKSLWKHTELQRGAGYEYVLLDGIIPRHRHNRSSTIWLVRDGKGYVGQDIAGQRIVEPISAGCYGYFPAGMWHGFYGDSLRFISAQILDIGEADYEFSDEQFDYPI